MSNFQYPLSLSMCSKAPSKSPQDIFRMLTHHWAGKILTPESLLEIIPRKVSNWKKYIGGA